MAKTVDFMYGQLGDDVGFFCEHLHEKHDDYYVNETTDGYKVIVCAACKDSPSVILQLLQGIAANKAEMDKFIAEARPGDSRLLPRRVFSKTGVHVEHTN